MGSQWIAIIGEDIAAAQGLEQTLRRAALETRSFSSMREFLAQPDGAPACVVTNLFMPGMSGLELQRQLATRDSQVPVVFITARNDVATIVLAMKAGAVSCLQSPVSESELIAAVQEGISRDAALRAERVARRQVSDLIQTLTQREREVLDLVLTGLANKQIAFQLGAAEKTIKVHRWRVMRKLQVKTSIHLVQLLAAVGPPPGALPRGRPGVRPHGCR